MTIIAAASRRRLPDEPLYRPAAAAWATLILFVLCEIWRRNESGFTSQGAQAVP